MYIDLSFAKERYISLLQKRPMFLGSLRIVSFEREAISDIVGIYIHEMSR